MPKITVIMPSLNVVKYIRQCMRSILTQTLRDIEILAIDAGSQDGTLEVLQEFSQKDNRVKLILSEQKSYGYQVNKGISLAAGEYIAIIETDDIAEPTMLEVLYKKAKEYDLDYVKGDFTEFIDFGNGIIWKRNMRIYPRKQEMYDNVLVPKNDLHIILRDVYLWRGIYKKSFLQEYDITFNETKGAAYQDVGFLFQTIFYARKAMYLPDIVYNYRKNNQDSSVYNPKAFGYLLQEYPFIREKFENADAFDEEMKRCFYVRMFMQIRERYRTMAATGIVWENTQKERLTLWKKIETAYASGYMDEYLLEQFHWQELQQYLAGEENYWQYEWNVYEAKRRSLHELLEKVKKAEKVVFYSKSITGGFVYCLLKAAGIEAPAYFCDNDEEKQGTFYMDAPIISVEDAAKMGSNTFYIIANRRFDQGMQQQLLDLKVNREQIAVWMLGIDIILLQMIV